MTDRYFRVDVSFMHKKTCSMLREKLGPVAPLVFLALCAQAKVNNPPGTFFYENEALGWARLGFTGYIPDFTLDEFFGVTGRLKQSSRRRNGLGWDVLLTRYALWQKDSRRYEEAVRKSSKRAQTAADTKRTPRGTRSGHKGGPSSSSISTPNPNGKKQNDPLKCPRCRHDRPPFRNAEDLEGHLEDVHGQVPTT